MGYRESIPVTDGLVLAIIPAAASLLDHSGDGRHPTQAGTGLGWIKSGGVWQLRSSSTGRLVVANDATLEAVTDNSFFLAGTVEDIPSSQARLFSKRDAGGTQIESFLGATGRIDLYDGAVGSSITVGSWFNIGSLCIQMASGQKPTLFTNGVPFGEFNIVINVTGDNSDIYLLNNFVGSLPLGGYYKVLLWYSRNLTADENSMLNTWSKSLTSPSLPHDRSYFDMGPRVENGNPDGLVVGAYDFAEVFGRSIADKSGEGIDGALNGTLSTARTDMGSAARNSGDAGSDAGITLSPAITANDDLTVETLVRIRSLGATAGRLFQVAGVNVFFTGSPVANIVVTMTGVTGSPWTIAGVVQDEWMHLVITREKSTGHLGVYVNGEAIRDTTEGTEALNWSGTVYLLNNAGAGAGTRAMDGDCRFINLFERHMEAAEVKHRYQPIRDKLLYQLLLDQVPPGLTSSTAGEVIPETDYTVQGGVFAVQEVASENYRKGIVCVTAGPLSRLNPYARGSFGFSLDKDSVGQIDVMFITNTPGLFTVPGTNGYLFRAAGGAVTIFRITNGAGVATPFTSVAGVYDPDVVNDFWITRTKSGVFSVYIKKPGLPWALMAASAGANPFTDNIHAISVYVSRDFDAGDILFEDEQYLGVITPQG